MATCMIVDDSDVIRRVTKSIFAHLKHESAEAADGAQALDRVREKMPDAILVDWHMPRMTGVEVIAALRALPSGHKPKIVYCATEHEAADLVRAFAAGADDYVMKPYDVEAIKAKLSALGIN
jgi:two-component system, chemotaxis family, chemotaxis protein CheY